MWHLEGRGISIEKNPLLNVWCIAIQQFFEKLLPSYEYCCSLSHCNFYPYRQNLLQCSSWITFWRRLFFNFDCLPHFVSVCFLVARVFKWMIVDKDYVFESSFVEFIDSLCRCPHRSIQALLPQVINAVLANSEGYSTSLTM